MTRVILLLVMLAGCSPPPEQPALLTYGTGTPLCILFCTSSSIFADQADQSAITNTLGDTTATGAQSDSGNAGSVGIN